MFSRALASPENTVVHSSSQEQQYRYGDLLRDSGKIKDILTQDEPFGDLNGQRVAYLCPPSYSFVACQWGIWRAGGVIVPLCVIHPEPHLQYVIEDSQSSIIVAHSDFTETLRPIANRLGLRLIELEHFTPESDRSRLRAESELEIVPFDKERNALILYTSGTTGEPKGALFTHDRLGKQIDLLTKQWKWTSKDHGLHTVPLHHVLGLTNYQMNACYIGASLTFLPKFDEHEVWDLFLKTPSISVFMAVPTIFIRLLRAYEMMTDEEQQKCQNATRNLRLVVAGAAAMPQPVSEHFTEITGVEMLERFGMTECGIVTSQNIDGVRIRGSSGKPIPGAQCNISKTGELLVKTVGMFNEYWGRPGQTARAFDEDGWFKTGDEAECDENTGEYRIIGRTSTDVLKCGGYKVSALEVERVVLEHQDISEVCVVGVDNADYGQTICACVVQKKDTSLIEADEFKNWCRQKLAPYQIPRILKVVDTMPCKTVIGKVNKKELVKIFQ